MPPITKKKPSSLQERVSALKIILDLCEPIPDSWKKKPGQAKQVIKEDELIPCDSYRDLANACRKAMKWTDGLDCALSVMLASVTSTMVEGDQLWVKIIGPASCGKSTLCEAVSANTEFVLAKSTIRGFHSGFSDSEEGQDHSLISKVGGKTLVTKDGDTLLQSPNLGQILSEARDVYDTVSRTSYRNKMSRDYVGVRMTWILCGTSSLRSIDSSELGERFLDCVIMYGIDDELEDEILVRVAHRAQRNVGISVGKKDQEAQSGDPEMRTMKGMTGGYVSYLRKNAEKLLSEIQMSDRAIHLCTRLAKFVALMRARPSKFQEENAEREFAARLVSQHVRLAMCLAAVLNRKQVDTEVLRRTKKVSLDTSRGKTMELAEYLYQNQAEGMEVKGLSLFTNQTDQQVRTLLRFLRAINVAEPFKVKTAGVSGRPRWRLTETMYELYSDVMED